MVNGGRKRCIRTSRSVGGATLAVRADRSGKRKHGTDPKAGRGRKCVSEKGVANNRDAVK
jgi:hypothetical protein